MGIFSKKYDGENNYASSKSLNELREMLQTIGTKVAILESELEGIKNSFVGLRARLNRNARQLEEVEEDESTDSEGSKTEAINNPVLLPEDGFIRKNSKRR